ncbi:hypothetical protein CIB84_007486 [Bambusicola thoracicus]|uniref:Uncharacterized protein n=1 Tax=Bambusicola thoracicus TaxID=9083 RepID=A0A2P4SXD6_BAMTH|nr:hypothetical protein CIB84_007486 [Bambusicola thoracicus]
MTCRRATNDHSTSISVKPKVRVSVLKLGSLPQTDWFSWSTMGFYLLKTEVTSFQNGHEEVECVMLMDMI